MKNLNLIFHTFYCNNRYVSQQMAVLYQFRKWLIIHTYKISCWDMIPQINERLKYGNETVDDSTVMTGSLTDKNIVAD